MEFWDRVKWDVRRLYWQGRKVLLHTRIGEKWVESHGGFRQRDYPDYATYAAHQKTKFSALRSKSVMNHDERLFDALVQRLEALDHRFHRRSVLCLAARQGSEVRAFIEQGAFAVGIDLNPGPENRYVVVGDFHALQFADGSLDYVFTNSLDHAFDLDRILAEVRRVLRNDGAFIVEANTSDDDGDGAHAGPYEATVWEDLGPLVDRIQGFGFEIEHRQPFRLPWPGEQLVFRRVG
ncbi:MAG: class I SAM-dependent methyltransferase [Gemmatimonadota bacterium]|jgi:SAM-dependent methyltransferase